MHQIRYSEIRPLNLIWIIASLLLLGACASLPDRQNIVPTKAFPGSEQTRLYQLLNPGIRRHHGLSAYHLLGDNLNAFTARTVLIRQADRSIDAQYYALEDDLTGRLFLKNLLDAADRGVRVRLLMDDSQTAGRDALFAHLDSHPDMQVRAFNPSQNRNLPLLSFLTDFSRLNRRMHNKALVVDNIASIVGGRNIGDKYFSASSELEFGDLDLLAHGPVSAQVAQNFDRFWNSDSSYPFSVLYKAGTSTAGLQRVRQQLDHYAGQQKSSVYVQHLRQSAFARQVRAGQLNYAWARGRVYSDDPRQVSTPRTDLRYSMSPHILALANQSQQEITIFSPYFIPTRWGENTFRHWNQRRIRVRVLTNSLASNDVPAVHSGYSKYRVPLLREKVELYELRPDHSAAADSGIDSAVTGLHAKSFVFDRQRLFVGSMNLDDRSTVLNTEMGLFVESPVLAGQLAGWFDRHVGQIAYQVKLMRDQQGREHLVWLEQTPKGTVTYTHDPKTGVFKRLGVKLLGLLPVEGQL